MASWPPEPGSAVAAYGLGTPGAFAARLRSSADSVSFGSNASDPVPKAAYAQVFKAFTKASGHEREGQHRRPQHVPDPDQLVPAGPAAGRLHLVRRLPHAVLRPEEPARADRRRVGLAQAELLAGPAGGLEGPRRALLLRADLQLPVGRLLPQERVRGQGLQGPEDLGRLPGAGQADEGRRHHPAGLHRQGRLARDGDVRHPQHADQRLRLPHPPDERQGVLGQPEGQGRLQPLARAAAVLLERRARADLAGRRPAADPQAGRHDAARLVPRPAGHGPRRPRGPRLLRLPGDQPDPRPGLDRRADRRLPDVAQGQEQGRRQGAAQVPGERGRREHLPEDRPERRRDQQEAPAPRATTRCRRSRRR